MMLMEHGGDEDNADCDLPADARASGLASGRALAAWPCRAVEPGAGS